MPLTKKHAVEVPSTSVEERLRDIKVSFNTRVESFCESLKNKQAADPSEYSLDDEADVIDMFREYLVCGDF